MAATPILFFMADSAPATDPSKDVHAHSQSEWKCGTNFTVQIRLAIGL